MHIKHLAGGLPSGRSSVMGPHAAIHRLPCYSFISVALHLTFGSAEMRTASSVMRNESRMCNDVSGREWFHFQNGSSSF